MTKDDARLVGVVVDYVAQLEELDRERYAAEREAARLKDALRCSFDCGRRGTMKLLRDLLLAPLWFLLAGCAWLISKVPERWF